jgi:hypothetical protein
MNTTQIETVVANRAVTSMTLNGRIRIKCGGFWTHAECWAAAKALRSDLFAAGALLTKTRMEDWNMGGTNGHRFVFKFAAVVTG